MPEIKKVEIETQDAPPAPAPSDRVLDLAERVGAMSAREQQRDADLAEVKAGQSGLSSMMTSISETLQRLESRQSQTEERAEVAQATAAAAIVEAAAKDESAEDQSGVLEITPPMETKIQIEQKPATGRRWWQKAIYGR